MTKYDDAVDNSMMTDSKFSDVLRTIKGSMSYTDIPGYVRDEINDKCKPVRILDPGLCAADPTKFAYFVLGIIPYSYQYMFLEKIRDGARNIIMISSRQLGKTTLLAIFALWAAYYNVYPSGIYKNTKIVIVSRGEQQATDILSNIKRMIEMGDHKFAVRTSGQVTNVISSELADNQPQTASQITFKNGSSIRSYPPTDRVRGSTADVLVLDECAFIDEDLFFKILEPTTSAVRGLTIMTSTPNGQQGLGYKIFDPNNEKPNNPYVRFWIPWWYCENDAQKKDIEDKKERWIADGKIKDFQQEYEAKFTVTESNFFESDKVDDSVDSDLSYVLNWHSEPCSLGIDYGWKSSKTALTVVSKAPDGKVRVRFHHAYPNDGTDVNILNDVQDLKKRFTLKWVVPDDCAMGYQTNQKMINLGLPVKLFNFRTDQNAGERNRGYYILRAAMYNGRVKLVKDYEMLKELKMLLEIKKMINVTIKSPDGENDDRADSLCMACFPFISDQDDDGDLAAVEQQIEPTEEDKNKDNPRFDKAWAAITGEL